MFMEIERSYLVARARAFRRQGLNPSETYEAIQADLHGFSASERIRCAIISAYRTTDHSAAIL